MKKRIALFCIAIIACNIGFQSAQAYIADNGYSTLKTISRNDGTIFVIGSATTGTSYVIRASTSVPSSVFTLSGYTYQTTLTVQNTCPTDYYGRFVIDDFPGSNLANGGYIQADGDDLALTYEGSTEQQLTAMVGSGGHTLLLDYYDLAGNSTLNGTLYMGNASMTRDQWWIGDADDSILIADDASLDITTNLTISTDIYLPEVPDSTQTIVSKVGAYQLLVDTTPELVFRIYGPGGGGAISGSGSPSSTLSSTLVLVTGS